jgi:cytochrome c oxidase subunit II
VARRDGAAVIAPLLAGLVAAAAAFLLLSGGSARPVASASPEDAGRIVFTRMGCGGCHRLAAADARGEIGPDLDARLPGHTAASLRAQIIDPGASAEFAQMPSDFGERMSRGELDALVAFLLETARR